MLWREARAAYHGSLLPLGGRFFDGRSRWDLAPLRYALGFTSENSRPERFQGFHAGLILFIVDEASAVPAPIWEAIKGSSLSGTALILAFSNPSRLTGEFYQAFHAKQHLWRRFHISAFDTPNFTGEAVIASRRSNPQSVAGLSGNPTNVRDAPSLPYPPDPHRTHSRHPDPLSNLRTLIYLNPPSRRSLRAYSRRKSHRRRDSSLLPSFSSDQAVFAREGASEADEATSRPPLTVAANVPPSPSSPTLAPHPPTPKPTNPPPSAEASDADGPSESSLSDSATTTPTPDLPSPPRRGQGEVIPSYPFPHLVSPAAIEALRLDWPEDSSLYQIRVLGNFPTQGAHTLISTDWLAAIAQEAAKPLPATPLLDKSGVHLPTPEPSLLFSLGVDVAREGSAQTAFALLHDNRLIHLEAFHEPDVMRIAARVKTLYDRILHGEFFPDKLPRKLEVGISIDESGAGGGLTDRLRELDVFSRSIKFGAAAEGRMAVHFRNKSAEMYWLLREAIRTQQLLLPHDEKLFAELTQLEYEVESDKAIRVYKQGLEDAHPSPDRADALALAWEARTKSKKGLGILF